MGNCNTCNKIILMYVLIDCNNFYASCERLFQPNLNKKPIVILSNNDGCVIARSNEAKAFVPMGAPAFKFKDIFKEKKVHVFSSNFTLYGDLSARIMQIISKYSLDFEPYSIDEAFIKIDVNKYTDLESIIIKLKKEIELGVGVPISIGIAPTKSLAKVANRISKKYPKRTKGIYIIDDEKKRIKSLKWLQINDIWGIGKRHSKRLKEYGINNALEFCSQNDKWVKNKFSIVELKLKQDLCGIPTIKLEEVKRKKSISCTRSFDRSYSNCEQIKERIASFSINCAEKLRLQNSKCNAMIVFLRTNRHKKNQQQYSKSIFLQSPFPTNSSIEISKLAIDGFMKIFKKGYQYKKAGVIITNFTPENQEQLTLFENSNPKHKNLMKTMDYINHSLGAQKIKLASQDLKKTWKMKQEKLSRRYTTKLDEIIVVNV